MPELLITDAGLAAAVDANNNGLSLELTSVVVADGRYDPAATQTALMGTSIATVNFSAGRQSGNQITLSALFTGAAGFVGYEIGIFAGNVLFAVGSDGASGDALLTKVASVNLAWQLTIILSRVPSGSVTVSPSISITVENATESVRGIAELATQAETDTGTDDERIVTPLKLATRLAALTFTPPNASTTVRGIVELATNTEARTGTDTQRAVTPAGLAAAVPQANTTTQGKVELATNAEANAGTDTARAVTPSNLPSAVPDNMPNASTTVRGKIELATNTETQTGVDSQRAVTPAGLSARTATETRRGIVERATEAEAEAGTDTERYVTPAGMQAHGDGRYLRSARRIQERAITSAGNLFNVFNNLGLDVGEYLASGLIESQYTVAAATRNRMLIYGVRKESATTFYLRGTFALKDQIDLEAATVGREEYYIEITSSAASIYYRNISEDDSFTEIDSVDFFDSNRTVHLYMTIVG